MPLNYVLKTILEFLLALSDTGVMEDKEPTCYLPLLNNHMLEMAGRQGKWGIEEGNM